MGQLALADLSWGQSINHRHGEAPNKTIKSLLSINMFRCASKPPYQDVCVGNLTYFAQIQGPIVGLSAVHSPPPPPRPVWVPAVQRGGEKNTKGGTLWPGPALPSLSPSLEWKSQWIPPLIESFEEMLWVGGWWWWGCWSMRIACCQRDTGGIKDYKGGYRLASKIKDEEFEADLYMKHWCTRALCTVHTGWIEHCKVLASFCG